MNKDARDILTALANSDGSYVLATVTRTEGSSYRRPGARMLVGPAGRIAGSVSGGCLERDLVQRGSWLSEDGPRLLRLSTVAEPDEPDEIEQHHLGCGGTTEILIERISTSDSLGPLALLRWIGEQGGPAVLATVTGSDVDAIAVGACGASTQTGQRVGRDGVGLLGLCAQQVRRALASGCHGHHSYAVGGGRIEVFVEFVARTRELLVAGRHHDVRPLIEFARLLGWETTVAAGGTDAVQLGSPDHLIEMSAGRVKKWAVQHDGAAVVVMTHSLALDRALLGAVVEQANLAYVGLLGPSHRAADILHELPHSGGVTRLHAPVGLDLGGDGPEAVALSIAAEIQATWSGRSAQALCTNAPWNNPQRRSLSVAR